MYVIVSDDKIWSHEMVIEIKLAILSDTIRLLLFLDICLVLIKIPAVTRKRRTPKEQRPSTPTHNTAPPSHWTHAPSYNTYPDAHDAQSVPA